MKYFIIIFLLSLLCFADTKTIIIYRTCPICQGHAIEICNACNGTGKIKVNYLFSDEKFRYEKCEKCNGTCILSKCYYCNGTGKIKIDSLIVR